MLLLIAVRGEKIIMKYLFLKWYADEYALQSNSQTKYKKTWQFQGFMVHYYQISYAKSVKIGKYIELNWFYCKIYNFLSKTYLFNKWINVVVQISPLLNNTQILFIVYIV